MKVCLVTGASKGIGAAIYDALIQAGHRVYGTMRNPKSGMLQMDVKDRASIEAAVAHVLEKEGRIDVLVNNAGHGLAGTVEMVSDQEMQEQFDVNVFGLIRVTQAVLPSMREQKSGCIINLSSLSGVRCSPFMALYTASKFAVEAISLSLAVTLEPWNIRTHVINPGWVNTDFLDNVQMAKNKGPYATLMENYLQYSQEGIRKGQDPKEVGEIAVKIVDNENADFRNPTTEAGQKTVEAVLVEPTGNAWIKDLQERFRDWY